jgi:hypothetical protein
MTVLPLKCLYYPYSRALNLDALKKAVLLFDQIAFVDSQPHFVRRQLMRDTHTDANLADLDEIYEYLVRTGICEFIDPGPSLDGYDVLLTNNIVNDVKDEAYCQTALQESVETWRILRERLPRSFLKRFYPGAGTFSEAISLQALIKSHGSVSDIEDEQVRRFAEFRWRQSASGSFDEKRLWGFFVDRYRWVVGGNPHVELETYEIPFLQASSLRLNEALLICTLRDYVPFTDSSIHDRLMTIKVSRSLKMVSLNTNLQQELQVHASVAVPKEQLAISILDQLVPKAELAKRSIKELVEYRKQNQDALRRFREKLAELSSDIASVEPGAEHYLHLSRIMASKVMPEISKARDAMLTQYEDAFGKLALRSAQVLAPTLLATVFGGLSIWQVLGACALAEIGMLSVKGADELLTVWKARRSAGRAGFAYLTDL